MKRAREVKWKASDKLGAAVIAAGLIYFLFRAAVPGTMFLDPLAYIVKEDIVTFKRKTPRGEVWADWRAEISLIRAGGFECSGGGTSKYQPAPGNLVRYRLQPWAQDCLEAGPPMVARIEWQVRPFYGWPLLHHVRLRPIVRTYEIPGDRVELPNYMTE